MSVMNEFLPYAIRLAELITLLRNNWISLWHTGQEHYISGKGSYL